MATLVMLSIAMLLVSGFVNLFLILSRQVPRHIPEQYVPFHIRRKVPPEPRRFLFRSRLVARTAGRAIRTRESFWASFNLTLAVIVVCLAGFMKLADRRPQDAPAPPPAGPAAAAPDAISP